VNPFRFERLPSESRLHSRVTALAKFAGPQEDEGRRPWGLRLAGQTHFNEKGTGAGRGAQSQVRIETGVDLPTATMA
jgi:hypothetical protein